MHTPIKTVVLSVLGLMMMGILGSCSSQKETIKGSDCIDPNPNKAVGCIEVYQPVCGCDGKTYPNSCYAEREGIKKWKEGKCNE